MHVMFECNVMYVCTSVGDVCMCVTYVRSEFYVVCAVHVHAVCALCALCCDMIDINVL